MSAVAADQSVHRRANRLDRSGPGVQVEPPAEVHRAPDAGARDPSSRAAAGCRVQSSSAVTAVPSQAEAPV